MKTCLLIIALAAGLAPQARRPRPAPAPAPAPAPPTVSLCSLLSKPADYDGKEVRVRAQLNNGFEHAYVYDPLCRDFAVETTLDRTANVVWVELARSVVKETAPEVYAKFRELTALCCPDTGWRDSQAEVVLVGRFARAPAGKGFGHMSLYAFKLTVGKIEQAEPLPPES